MARKNDGRTRPMTNALALIVHAQRILEHAENWLRPMNAASGTTDTKSAQRRAVTKRKKLRVAKTAGR